MIYELSDLSHMLKVKFRFRPGHRDTFISTPPWRLQGLFLNLTDYCNLRCGYCHASFQSPPGFMPLDLVTRALDQAADLGAKDILLTGGEPFLHPDFEKVLAECHERTLGCKIATNGTFLDEAHVNVLLKNEVKSLQISLDTLDADIYAAIKGVKPNIHGKVIDGIRRCIKTNQLHIAVSSVADLPVMPGLIDLMSFCYNEYIDTFTLYHMIPYGRAMAKEAALAEADFIKALDELLDAFLKLPNHWAVDLGVPCSPQSSLFQKWRDKVDIKPIGCIAGKSSMTILASGEAVPCVCMEDKSFSCGNIKNMALSELWESPAMSLFRGEIVIPSCESCPSRQFCLGGCRTLACLISKQPHGPDPMCPYWKLS